MDILVILSYSSRPQGCPTDAEVGVAWLGTLCQTDTTGSAGSYVSSTGVSTAAQVEWSLISHEIVSHNVHHFRRVAMLRH